MKFKKLTILPFIMAIFMVITGYNPENMDVSNTANTTTTTVTNTTTEETTTNEIITDEIFTLEEIPEYTDNIYVVINNNNPSFTKDDYTKTSFETYSELDSLGRCGVAFANVGVDIMPTEDRSSISSVKPTGWQTIKYDVVEGKYLYNRCHLIGFQLTGENANKANLITGTRSFNVDGMLPFENMVADYVKETENHVLYRVTPMYEGEDLVAKGVQIEAWSVEDEGESICFNVFIHNIQSGVIIDYATGESALADAGTESETKTEETTYVLNTNGKKFHKPDCANAKNMKEESKETYKGTRENLISQGYAPCGNCKP